MNDECPDMFGMMQEYTRDDSTRFYHVDLSYAKELTDMVQALRTRAEKAEKSLSEWENSAKFVRDECPDEVHCGCVPVLRGMLGKAEQELADNQRELCQLLGVTLRPGRNHIEAGIIMLQERLEKAEARLDQKTAEVDVLRGDGMCEADGDGPCGICLKCIKKERDIALVDNAAMLGMLKDFNWDCLWSMAGHLMNLGKQPHPGQAKLDELKRLNKIVDKFITAGRELLHKELGDLPPRIRVDEFADLIDAAERRNATY
jgi:hypothetical protein